MFYKFTVVVLFTGLVSRFVVCEIAGSEENNVGRGLDPKGILTELANNFMSRGFGPTAGGSQVISLNVTNLLVLILLKALIFAAGSIGAGTWKGGYARSMDGDEKLLTDEEILMYLSYLTGSPGNNGCLQNIACRQPTQAMKYAAAGDMLLKTSKILGLNVETIYENTLKELEEAAKVGLTKQECHRFICETSASSPYSYSHTN